MIVVLDNGSKCIWYNNERYCITNWKENEPKIGDKIELSRISFYKKVRFGTLCNFCRIDF